MKYQKWQFLTVPNKNILKGKPPILQSVYFWICDFSNAFWECFPSLQAIADCAWCSRRSVIEYIKELEKMGILVKTNRWNGKEQTSNLYQIMIIESAGDSPPPSAVNSLPSEQYAPPPSAGDAHEVNPLSLSQAFEQNSSKEETANAVWGDQEKQEESESLEKEEIEEEKSSAKKEEGELAEYWRSDVNEIIKIMKQSCNDVWLQYMPWYKERAFAKHMLSKKLAKEIEKYNCPLEEFIRKVITASKQPYMKKVNSPKDFYDNRWYIVNASNQKTDSIKTISVI